MGVCVRWEGGGRVSRREEKSARETTWEERGKARGDECGARGVAREKGAMRNAVRCGGAPRESEESR